MIRILRSSSARAGSIALALCASVAGCGGGGGGGSASSAPVTLSPSLPTTSSAAPAVPAGMTQAQLQIALDGSVTLQLHRRERSVSPATRGLGIVVTPAGGTPLPAVYFPLTSATTCTVPASDGSRVCSFFFPVPVGSSTALITTYSGTPSSSSSAPTFGGPLGTATVPITATAGAVTAIPASFNPIVSRVAVSFSNRPQVFSNGAATVNVTAYDAANQAIVGADPYVNAITLSNSDASGVTQLSTTTVTSPSTAVTLAYNGAIPTMAAAITASFTPVPGYTPQPSPLPSGQSFTPPPAVFVPLGPRPGAGSFQQFVQLNTTMKTVASPVPTIAAYPNSSFQPSPVPLTSTSTQMTTSWSSPSPTNTYQPTVNGTPIPAYSLTQLENLGNTLTNQTNNSVNTYYNYVVDGNRLDLVKLATFANSYQQFPSGTRSVNRSTVWPNGAIVAKSPLTAGDTWTNTAQRTMTYQVFDNRPFAYYSSTYSTVTYAADGSFTWAGSNTVNQTQGGGVDTVNVAMKPDGSGTETDTFSAASGGYTEVDTYPAPPLGGSAKITVTITPGSPTSVTAGTYTLPDAQWFPLPLVLASDTYVVGAAGALPTTCGAATVPGPSAYPVTETLQAISTQGATITKTTSTDYVIPGAGSVCTSATTTTESHYVFTVPATLLFEAFTVAPPYAFQTDTIQRLQVQPFALAPQAAVRGTSSGASLPLDADAQFIERMHERMEQRAQVNRRRSTRAGIR